MGFEIDATQGVVGDTVYGVVSVDDIAEHCITSPGEFLASIPTIDPSDPAEPYTQWVIETGQRLGVEEALPFEHPARVALLIMGVAPGEMAADPDVVEEAMAETFVMAFADLESASPIEPMGSFDPISGEGSVNVPDLAPGTHPVISTCASVPEDWAAIDWDAAHSVAIAKIEELTASEAGFDMFDDGAEVFGAFIRELMEPRALGIQLFCVDDGTGSCDEDETPDPTDPETPPGEGGEGDGDGGNGGSQAPGATPVKGRPSYTG